MLQKIIYVILGISIALVFMPRGVKEYRGTASPEVLGTHTSNSFSLRPAPELALNLSVPELTARAAFAFDLYSGTILFTKNFEERLPVASLTKLMTALLAVKMDVINETVEIKKPDTAVVGNKMGLVPGEQIKAIDLLYGLLISSSNDAASALAGFISGDQLGFVLLMNQEANSLGMNSTQFNNPVGWDSDQNYSTAHDLSILVREFLKHELLSDAVKIKEMEVSSIDGAYKHKLTTTNKLLLENSLVSGIKTGFTSQAKGNLIIRAGNPGQEIITIVLGSDNREEDSRQLLNWIFQVYRW